MVIPHGFQMKPFKNEQASLLNSYKVFHQRVYLKWLAYFRYRKIPTITDDTCGLVRMCSETKKMILELRKKAILN